MTTKVKSKAQLKEKPQDDFLLVLKKLDSIAEKLSEINASIIQQNDNNRKILTDINNLKETISQQNNGIIHVLSEHIVALKSSFKSHFEAPKFTELFPLESEDNLHSLEKMINDENKSELVSSIRRIIGSKGIQKNLTKLISNNIILEYNVRGIQGKKRLLNFKNVMNVIFLASNPEVSTELEFIAIMRRALKSAKNKYFKSVCLNKKADKENRNFES